jgi:integrase
MGCAAVLIRFRQISSPPIPKKFQMTWIPASRRWTKFHRGRRCFVSCRQLGDRETKEASWLAANEWWERTKGIANLPSEDARVERAARISRLVRDFSKLDDDARKEAVEALLGAGAYDSLTSQVTKMLAGMDSPAPKRTVKAQIEAWKSLLHGICQSGQMSEGRYDAYCRNIVAFTDWVGLQAAIDEIDEAKLEGFFNHLTAKVGAGEYSATYAHTLLMAAKPFISRPAELKLIVPLGNIRSRRLRFNHSVAAEIETFTVEEVRALLGTAGGLSERTQLYMLLMLNCGMYQNDIAELRADEVNWKAGIVRRARSKTRERGAPVVTYKLWPETFALLKKHRATGDLALTTDEGNPLVQYWLEGDRMRRYDAIQSAVAPCRSHGGQGQPRTPASRITLPSTTSEMISPHSPRLGSAFRLASVLLARGPVRLRRARLPLPMLQALATYASGKAVWSAAY